MNGKKALSRLLLAFVLVSVGVAIGRQLEKRHASGRLETHAEGIGPANGTDPPTTQPATVRGQEKVVVYYLHATWRCADCNAVEAAADELIRSEFADALASGRLEWKQADYLQNERLATRYNVGGNMIVVARFQAGQEVEARRLDEVMNMARDRARLTAYIRAAIVELLKEAA